MVLLNLSVLEFGSQTTSTGPEGAVPDEPHTNYVVTGRKRFVSII